MRTIAGMVNPGLEMTHEFLLPEELLTTSMDRFGQALKRVVRKDFLEWCEFSLCGYVIIQDAASFKIRICHEDYVLIRFKYFKKETTWQKTI